MWRTLKQDFVAFTKKGDAKVSPVLPAKQAHWLNIATIDGMKVETTAMVTIEISPRIKSYSTRVQPRRLPNIKHDLSSVDSLVVSLQELDQVQCQKGRAHRSLAQLRSLGPLRRLRLSPGRGYVKLGRDVSRQSMRGILPIVRLIYLSGLSTHTTRVFAHQRTYSPPVA